MAALRENQRMHQELTSKVTKPGEDEEEELYAEPNTKVKNAVLLNYKLILYIM